MEPVYRCVAGIEVHKKMLAVVIRRDQNGQPQYEKRKFGATRKEVTVQVVRVVAGAEKAQWSDDDGSVGHP